MQSFFDCAHRLARVDVGAGRDPHSLKTRVGEHLLIRIVDGNVELLVLLEGPGPFQLMSFRAADGDN